jgi:mannose-6-phosphate isomerase-like protein (cupin superfamily)
VLVHWDDVGWESVDLGELSWERQRLVPGLSRYRAAAGARIMPVHVHVDEEEHVFALTGSGLSWQDGRTVGLRAGEVVNHRADTEAHTLIAGGEGLEVLIFASGSPTGLTRLPRARVLRVGRGWWPPEVEDPLAAEPVLGAVPAPDDHAEELGAAEVGGDHARLRRLVLSAGETDGARRRHTAVRERWVVLAGTGTALLDGDEHALRAGSVVAVEPGTAHQLRAGDGELVVLAHATRVPGDLVLDLEDGRP